MKISKVRLFVIQKQNNSSGTHLNGIVVWKSAYEGELDVKMTTIHLLILLARRPISLLIDKYFEISYKRNPCLFISDHFSRNNPTF